MHGGVVRGAGADRVLYLRPRAAAFVATLPAVVVDATERRLARTLIDAGVAEPWWPGPAPTDAEVAARDEVTLVVPVHLRATGLARLLAALPAQLAVVVVDDASPDPGAVSEVATAHGARLLRHEQNRGPAAARNSGLAAVTTPLVVFCDSDVVPEPGWLGTLRRHLDDPAVALAAPRVLGPVARPTDSAVERYEQACSSLDLGSQAAQVRVRSRVPYVPSACLLARVDALGDGFDERMRAGEDVDLVWRLVAAGWRLRYEPGAQVRHEHRTAYAAWWRRKAFYGTSAADLAARHGSAVAPMVLSPWTAVLAGAVLAQRRWSLPVAAGSTAVATVATARRLREDGRWRTAAAVTARGAGGTLTQTARSLLRHHWPAWLLVATRSRRVRRAWAVAAVVEGLLEWRRVGARLDPATYLLLHRVDDLAYGAGLWRGAWRARSAAALVPALVGFPRPRAVIGVTGAVLDSRRRRGPTRRVDGAG